MGLCPRSCQTPGHLVTTLSISALSILSSLVSLCGPNTPLQYFTRILHENCPCLVHLPLSRSRPFSCSVILHPIPNRLLPLLLPLSALRSKSAKPITATCRLSLISCSLLAHSFFFSLCILCTYRCIQSISAGGEDAATMDLLQRA